MNITLFNILASTNDEAKEPKYSEGDAIVALEQTDGRGQRGHRWESRAGENLTFSAVLEPAFLEVQRQFLLSEAAALAVADTLVGYGIECRVKWTNDIYVGNRKICGMLIENNIGGNRLTRSVVGIGLNVNQTEFDVLPTNPTSMKNETGCENNTMEVLERLCVALQRRYAQIVDDPDELSKNYNALLFRRDEIRPYALPDGTRFNATLVGVEADGRMVLRLENQSLKAFMFKEVEFVL